MKKKDFLRMKQLGEEIVTRLEELIDMKCKTRNADISARQEKEIAKMEEGTTLLIREREELRKKIEKFIDKIDDSLVRQILYNRYVRGLSWQNIAILAGGYKSADGVRKIADRFFEKENK